MYTLTITVIGPGKDGKVSSKKVAKINYKIENSFYLYPFQTK